MLENKAHVILLRESMPKRACCCRCSLSRQFIPFLVLMGIDILAEILVSATTFLFLVENLGVSAAIAPLVLAAHGALESLLILIFGRFLDRWPRDGPLRMLVYTNPVRITVVVTIVLLEYFGVANTWLMGCIFFVLYTPADAGGSLAIPLTTLQLTAPPDLMEFDNGRRRLRDRGDINTYQYVLMNVAFVVKELGTAAARYWLGPMWGNRTMLLSGCAVWGASTILAFVLSRRYARQFPRVVRDESTKKNTAGCCTVLYELPFHLYATVIFLCVGTEFAFMQNGTLLSLYLIYRYGETRLYSLYQAINPGVIATLVTVLQSCGVYQRLDRLTFLIVGTGIQALAPLGMILWEPTFWPQLTTLLYVITFTLGESIGFSQLSETIMQIVPDDRYAAYASYRRVLAILTQVGTSLGSSSLIGAFCATDSMCKSPEAPLAWAVVVAIALVTPLGLLSLHSGVAIDSACRAREQPKRRIRDSSGNVWTRI
jgi:hypothetical protein